MEVAYRFGFDAAHHFENYPAGHPYRGIHGHSFQVEVAIEGAPDPTSGFVADLGEVQAACGEVREALDHRMLNEIEGLAKPSLENICLWIWRPLSARFPGLARVTVRRDSCGQSCTYTGSEPNFREETPSTEIGVTPIFWNKLADEVAGKPDHEVE